MKKFEIIVKNTETNEVEFTSATNSLILACDGEKDGKPCSVSYARSEAPMKEIICTVNAAEKAIEAVKKDSMKKFLFDNLFEELFK